MSEKAKRETWRDWLSPEATLAVLGPEADPALLVTREQLLESLQGVVTERELRYWESSGVLPRPVLRFHRDAVRALYPYWYDTIVGSVHSRRVEKLPPEEIRSYARDMFVDYASRLVDWGAGTGPPLPHRLIKELERLTSDLRERYGIQVDAASLTLRTVEGRRLSWQFPLFGGYTTLGYSTFIDGEGDRVIVNRSQVDIPVDNTVGDR